MLLSSAFFKNPINQTKSTDAADAFDKPILTLASLRRGTGNVQTNGLPTDNKTTLGLYRFPGNDIGALSAGIGQPAVPPVAPVLKFPSVSFTTVGNNVAQPDSDSASLATNALLKRLGENKFKATENEPYAAYMAQARLEREVAEAEKGASVGDLNLAREILRSAMAERRKQNEDDYLRKMLDSGMTAEDAQDELEEVRRANALQESRKVDDRSYQSKLLLVNLAKKRGITANINEPLTQTAPIMSPSPSDAMATAMGDASQGFGNAPLDVNRQFLTPAYYGRFLRKSRITDEEADRQAALNNMISSGQAGEFDTPLMLDAKRRELAIEATAENLANTLGNIRSRAIMDILPPAFFAEKLYTGILRTINKAPLNKARMTEKSVENMTSAELIIAINRAFGVNRRNIQAAIDFLRGKPRGAVAYKSLMVELLNHLKFTSIKTLLLTDIRIPPIDIQSAMVEFINSNRQRIDDMNAMSFDYTNALEDNAAQLFAEPKSTKSQADDSKKNLFFSNVGAPKTAVKQITENYGLTEATARRLANTIGEGRREQLDARDAEEQEKLSKARAIKLMREFASARKADRNAREMAELDETFEGAIASLTEARRSNAGGRRRIRIEPAAKLNVNSSWATIAEWAETAGIAEGELPASGGKGAKQKAVDMIKARLGKK
jgi:hypothetical protein